MSDSPALDPKKIFKIYAGSTELSPFHECYATNDTVLRSADGSIYYAYVRDFTATSFAHTAQTKLDSGFFPKILDENNASERLIEHCAIPDVQKVSGSIPG